MAHSAEQLMATAGLETMPPVRAHTGRYSKRLGVAVGIAALLLLVAWMRLGIIGGGWWKIQWLEVSGPFHRVSAEMVRGALSPALGRGYFALDMRSLHQSLQDLPWVAEVELRRRWPDTLEVMVHEHQPIAYWRDDAAISQLGELFPLQEQSLIQGLPRLFGPQGQKDQVLLVWREVQDALDRGGLIANEFHVSDRGAIWFRLAHGLRVDLGREQIAHRVQRFTAAVPQLRGRWGELPLRVDMRYSNGFAVEWPELPEGAVQPGAPSAPAETELQLQPTIGLRADHG